MFRTRIIAHEQVPSLVKLLQEREIRHGDVVQDVHLRGVGFYNDWHLFRRPTLIFAFCPANIVSVGDTFRASNAMRCLPLPDEVLWTPTAQRALQNAMPDGCGFADLKCTVASNGAIHVSKIRVLKVERAPTQYRVNLRGMYEQFCDQYGILT